MAWTYQDPRGLIAALALSLPMTVAVPAQAQEDDRSWLTAFLEDNLSTGERKVTITGFAGALSSRATIQQLTIADGMGVWLTLDDVVLDWSRSALLSGEVIVNELTAAKITLERVPEGEEEATAPEAAPFEFALPDLPVSIDIGRIAAPTIVLGAPVLGQALEASFEGGLHLSGGAGNIDLNLERNDAGPDARIALKASYANETGLLSLDLLAHEAANGILAEKLDLPGRPEAAITLKGEGKLDDFAADFRFESDGAARLAGPITFGTDEAGVTRFSADFKGDPAPLFVPEYAEFLGSDLGLKVEGRSWPAGGLRLDRLQLDARSLKLDGQVDIAADGLPQLLDVQARIVSPDGQPVLLPLGGPDETRLGAADLRLGFDARNGNGWKLEGTLEGLARPDLQLARAELRGSGRISREAGRNGVGGTLNLVAGGIAGLDADLATALGEDAAAKLLFAWRQGNDRLDLPQISLNAAGMSATGGLSIEGLSDALRTKLRLRVETQDVARFSGLAGRRLAGAAEASLSGEITPLSGAFDLDLSVDGQDLRIDQPEVDRLLAGPARLAGKLRRDEAGLNLSDLQVTASSLAATGQGQMTSAGMALSGHVDWGNLGDLGGSYGGALSADASYSGTATDGSLALKGWADNLRIGQAEVDRLLAGRGEIDLGAALEQGRIRLTGLDLKAPNLSADVRAEGNQGGLRVDGRLRDLALLVPEFPGAVTLSGTVLPEGGDQLSGVYNADLRVQGPGGIDGRVNGRLDNGRPDLAVSGRGDAALVNPFIDPVGVAGALAYDLRLAGGWGLENLNGRATLANGKVAVPARGISLERVAAAVDLSGGRAQLVATANADRGGKLRVEGPIALSAPFNADLRLQAAQFKLRDPELFETELGADLALSGPLLGQAQLRGVVNVGVTELRVPSTGFASAADLERVTHVRDSRAVQVTRARAGLGASGSGGSSASGGSGLNWLVDLVIRAPNRIFIRGRGLDAELGGEVRVGGTLANLIPSGGLELVRGRLDILGKRLTLSSATLTLEGDFVPSLDVRADNVSDSVTSTVAITGRADDPQVSFSSDPDMPQEEVLAWLLFGRGLDQISAFQALQLANAVATLAGRGGEGLVSKLRGSFGFDDLDVQTTEDGSTSVSAGKYISKNVYTEVGVAQDGKARISLNLDLKKGVTVKGRVDNDGSSGLGIYLERDY